MKISEILSVLVLLLIIPTTISISSETEPWPERSNEKVSFKKDPVKFYLKNYDECILKDIYVTAYTSHSGQTDSSPFIAAWNNKLYPVKDKLKAIAVSRDLLEDGLDDGDRVLVVRNDGEVLRCVVKDKMNRRFKNRIDLYFGTDKDGAMEFGMKSWSIIYKQE